MPRKSNTTIDKKTKEELQKQIIDEINTTIKDDIVNEVVLDIKKSIDTDYKTEIKKEIQEELTEDIKKSLKREEKKLSRRKTFKIVRLYIYLILVIACAGYLIYRLYATDNLSIINERLTKPVVNTTTTQVEQTTTEVVKDFDYYMERYADLLDNIKISNTDLIKGSNVADMLTSDKLALSYAILNDEIMVDGSIITINEEDMKNAYRNVFGSLDGYETSTFNVNGLNFAYSSSTSTYIAVGTLNDNPSYINNKIINIYEEDDNIVFEAKAYVIKDDYIYSASNLNYRLMKVSDDLDLSRIQNRLVTVIYRFEKVDNQYRLLSIAKK